MEGTPGAAERRPFREGRREAALGGLAGRHRDFSGGDDHEHVTRGVRADRVGVKLSSRAIAMGGAEHEAFSSRARSLTREDLGWSCHGPKGLCRIDHPRPSPPATAAPRHRESEA